MNGTNTNAARTNDHIRFAVTASCMTPRGAWAKSIGGGNSEAAARSEFDSAGFIRPEFGIAWGMQISLVRVETKIDPAGKYSFERETLAIRRA